MQCQSTCDFLIYCIVCSIRRVVKSVPPCLFLNSTLFKYLHGKCLAGTEYIKSCIQLSHQVVNVSRNSSAALKFYPVTHTL